MTEPRLSGTKTCRGPSHLAGGKRFEVELDVIAFAVDKTRPDGLRGHCRDCQRVTARSRKSNRPPTRRPILVPEVASTWPAVIRDQLRDA